MAIAAILGVFWVKGGRVVRRRSSLSFQERVPQSYRHTDNGVFRNQSGGKHREHRPHCRLLGHQVRLLPSWYRRQGVRQDSVRLATLASRTASAGQRFSCTWAGYYEDRKKYAGYTLSPAHLSDLAYRPHRGPTLYRPFGSLEDGLARGGKPPSVSEDIWCSSFWDPRQADCLRTTSRLFAARVAYAASRGQASYDDNHRVSARGCRINLLEVWRAGCRDW